MALLCAAIAAAISFVCYNSYVLDHLEKSDFSKLERKSLTKLIRTGFVSCAIPQLARITTADKFFPRVVALDPTLSALLPEVLIGVGPQRFAAIAERVLTPTDSVEIKLRLILGIEQDDIMWDKLLELDIFEAMKIVGLKNASPAQILEKILPEKWTLKPKDKDMIVMYKFGYEINGIQKQIDSKMVYLGKDQTYSDVKNSWITSCYGYFANIKWQNNKTRCSVANK